jgi:TonB-linked SusC/RagA family outer membrane protein
MKQKFNGLLTLMLVLITQITFAQDMPITGVVSDANGMPIAGANVKVKGTATGTQTDFDGAYKIKAKSSDVLVYSYTGMNVQELKVSGAKMNCRLASKATELEGVVVTALGIKREKKSLGYASQQISGDQVSNVPTTNFVNNLAGKVAGLEIKQGTNFGGSTNVVLRGFKSILGDNQALFIVDGVPILNKNINTTDQKNGRSGFDYGNSASDINPNDVADISVLKGAAATALYGSRAQNGAIIITTKRGKKNADLSVEFSSSFTTSTVDKSTFPEYQTEYGQGYLGQAFGAYLGSPRVSFGHDASYGPKYDGAQVWQYTAFIPGSNNFGQKTAWKIAENGPITFFKTGTTTVNNISIGGGTDKSTYRMSYGNTNANDIMPNGSINKNNFNGNASYKFNDKLTLNFNANYVTQRTIGRNSTGYNDNIMSNFRQWWATNVDLQEQKQLYEQSGGQNYTWNLKSRLDIAPQYWDNPYFQRNENYEKDSRNRFAGNASVSYDLSKSINLLARVGTDGYTMRVDERRTPGSVPASFGLNTVDQPSGYAVSIYDSSEQNYDFLSTFKKDIVENLNLNLILGTNFNVQNNYISQMSTSGGLFIPSVFTISNSLSAPQLPQIVDTRKEIFGAFSQASLGYKGTYYIEGSVRRDVSSALPKNNNAYWYSSASASIVFSGFDFLKDSNILKYGKIRAAFAQVGSDTNANLLSNTYTSQNPFLTSMYSYNTTAKNPNLKPQRLDNIEFGIEMQFLKNRLGFDVSWFENKAFDQILPLPISLATGSLNQYKNAGTLQTRGYEVSINATPFKTTNFSWDLNLNWSNPKTKVIELAQGVENIELGSLQGGITINAPLNQEYGSIWGTTYVEANGQHVIDTNGAYLISPNTNNYLGTFQVDWNAGLNNRFTYKNLAFSFLIDWKKGGSVFSLDQYYGYGTGLYPDSVGNNDLGFPIRNTLANNGGVILQGVMANPTYTPTNGQSEYITNTTRLDKSKSSQVFGTDPPAAAFVYDASYVKLREIQLTYSLPSKFLEKGVVKSASFSLIGNNLWIIDKKLPFSDPEAGLSSGNVQGYQSGPMPTTKNISFNVKINF